MGNLKLVSNGSGRRGRRYRMIKISPFTVERFSHCAHLASFVRRSLKHDKMRKQATFSTAFRFQRRAFSNSSTNPGTWTEFENVSFKLTSSSVNSPLVHPRRHRCPYSRHSLDMKDSPDERVLMAWKGIQRYTANSTRTRDVPVSYKNGHLYKQYL